MKSAIFAGGLVFALGLPAARGQATTEQRVLDFQHLAGLFVQNYAPYEHKKQLFQVDAFQIQPWIGRVRLVKDDLEFFEIAGEYVASLNDTHSTYQVVSTFRASAPIDADIYDGKVLIDFIDRRAAPASEFPFEIGDEIVTVDGRPVEYWLDQISRFVKFAEPRATRRLAASYLFFRVQAVYPRAVELGDTVRFEVRRASTGNLEAYELPWTKTGYPYTKVGPVPSPRGAAGQRAAGEAGPQQRGTAWYGAPYGTLPLLDSLANRKWNRETRLRGLGVRSPYFQLPAGFQLRLGRNANDFHFSGIYAAGGKRIGYLRIPNFSPANEDAAFNELANEVIALNQLTDGLVIDITRNTGGGCYAEDVMDWVIPWRYRPVPDQYRATRQLLVGLEQTYAQASQLGLPSSVLAGIERWLDEVRRALNENRALTDVLPSCGLELEREPYRDRNGNLVSYAKPVITLVDELTISYGDYFAATMQDNGRGILFGNRTNGAGGAVDGTYAGFYTEGFSSYTISIGTRDRFIGTDEYGTSNRIENIGVRPEVPFDYMTRDNLLSGGARFVEAFTQAMLAEIERSAQ